MTLRTLYRGIVPAVALAALSLAVLAAPVQATEIRKIVTGKGIVAWFVPDKSVPLIAFSFAFRNAGSATDPDGKEGLAEMASGLLDEGAGDMESQDFQRALENIAAQMSFSAGRDSFSGRLRTLTAERHPYSKPSDGTEKTVAALTTDDLKSFVRGRFSRDRLVIGVVGDITEQELKTRLDSVFGDLPATGPKFDIAETTPAGSGKTLIVRKQIPQSVIVLGHAGIKRDDPDWYKALLVTRVFGGGGLSSRLYEEVREKRGLAYSVYAYLSPMEHSGLVAAGVATQNARAAESVSVIRAEWKKLSEKGITAKELETAKTYLNGSFPLRLGSSRGIANMLVGIQMSDLGMDYIRKRPSIIDSITLKEANRVARRLFREKDLTVVIVGDPKGMEESR